MSEQPGASSRRIVIVDDHGMFREALEEALQDADDIEVAGSAASIGGAQRLVAEVDGDVDVALVDYGLPDGTGVDLAVWLQHRDPPVPSLILTASESIRAAAEAVNAGCAGFLRKSADLQTLVRAVQRVVAGDAVFDARTLSEAIDWLHRPAAHPVDLTARELEVLQALADGRTTTEISEDLVLSHHTVRNHVRNSLQKLDARSQLEAVVIASTMSLVDVGRGRRPPPC